MSEERGERANKFVDLRNRSLGLLNETKQRPIFSMQLVLHIVSARDWFDF